MSLSDAIDTAIRGVEVPAPVLEAAFGEVMDGEASPVRITALLVALRCKGETVGEIVAAATALRARAVSVPATLRFRRWFILGSFRLPRSVAAFPGSWS